MKKEDDFSGEDEYGREGRVVGKTREQEHRESKTKFVEFAV